MVEPFRLENLVVLQYASNNCYLQVRDLLKMSGESSIGGSCLSVDVKNGTWSYREWRDRQIGSSRGCSRNDSGVIGVYDRTDINQLSSMVHTAVEITHASHSSPLDD